MQDLADLFAQLGDVAEGKHTFTAQALADRPRFRIAKDVGGNPALLVDVTDSTETPEVALRHLSFLPGQRCRVQGPRGAESNEILGVLKCTTDDLQLRDYFLRVLCAAVMALPAEPTGAQLGDAVGRLAELFRALESPSRTSLQGLWCELFLIARAPRIRQAAMAWHAEPGALHDFAAGRQRIEVKSSVGPHRIHQFRLEQLLAPRGVRIVVASFLLDGAGRGQSIGQLWEEVVARRELTSALRDRLAHVLALALGRDWREARRVTFDPDAAAESLRLYDGADVPTVSPELPLGVSDVGFKAELTDVQPLSGTAIREEAGLLEAVFGR